MKLIAVLMLICISFHTYAQDVVSKPSNESIKLDENYLIILNDMDNQFENVRGKLYPSRIDFEKRYEAKIYLTGMLNYTNESDILIGKKYSSYHAEFGPYFITDELEKQKDKILYQVMQATADKWWGEEIDGGMKFTEVANPLKTVSVYSFYGDGSGMFIRVLYKVLAK